MPEVNSIAEFWDREIEHCEANISWVNQGIRQVVRAELGKSNPTGSEVMDKLREIARANATTIHPDLNDEILTFEDGSRLAIIAPGANTMAGSSRVMGENEQFVRNNVRGGIPYSNAVHNAWYWTENGKKRGNQEKTSATTGQECPETGSWVRQSCQRNCSLPRVQVEWVEKGNSMPKCQKCSSLASFKWAMPHQYKKPRSWGPHGPGMIRHWSGEET